MVSGGKDVVGGGGDRMGGVGGRGERQEAMLALYAGSLDCCTVLLCT